MTIADLTDLIITITLKGTETPIDHMMTMMKMKMTKLMIMLIIILMRDEEESLTNLKDGLMMVDIASNK